MVNMNQSDVGDFDYVVAKRSWDTIYSCGRLRSSDIESQYTQLQKANVIVINVVRDGRNVVRSMLKDWGWYSPFEWMECIRQSTSKNGIIALTVRYEDLLTRPDEVQKEIILSIGMVADYTFSEYPAFVETDEQRENSYTFRPLDASKGIPDKETYLQSPNDIEHFNGLLSQLKYTL